jgi:hypothetical protein
VKRRQYTNREILARPALNGGWDELMRVQGEQSAELTAIQKRLDGWDARWSRLFLAVAGMALTVCGQLILDLIRHLRFQ